MNDDFETQEKSRFNDLSDILAILRRRSNLIIWTTVIITILSLVVSLFCITPKYSSTTEILVNRKQNNDNLAANGAQIQTDVQMISTYKDIITSPAILNEVSQKITYQGHHLNVGELKKDISITSQQNSQVFSLQVKSDNPQLSAAIANTTAQVFKARIKSIMNVNNVSILSKASSNPHPVSPRVLLNTVIGLVVGLLIGLILAFLINGLDRTVDSESFITDVAGLNDLGMISEIPANKIKSEIIKQHHHNSNEHYSHRRV